MGVLPRRHPLDRQNTRLLKLLPGVELVVKALLGPVAESMLLLDNVGTSVQVPRAHPTQAAADTLAISTPAPPPAAQQQPNREGGSSVRQPVRLQASHKVHGALPGRWGRTSCRPCTEACWKQRPSSICRPPTSLSARSPPPPPPPPRGLASAFPSYCSVSS